MDTPGEADAGVSAAPTGAEQVAPLISATCFEPPRGNNPFVRQAAETGLPAVAWHGMAWHVAGRTAACCSIGGYPGNRVTGRSWWLSPLTWSPASGCTGALRVNSARAYTRTAWATWPG